MNRHINLLFVCEPIEACSCFHMCLEREGCRVTVVINTEDARRTLLFPAAIDAVLIHDDNIVRGSTVASGLKLISPRTPVLMVSNQWPSKGIAPFGPDALYHTTSLNGQTASDVASFIRHLIAEKSLHLVEKLPDGLRPFVPRRRIYLN